MHWKRLQTAYIEHLSRGLEGKEDQVTACRQEIAGSNDKIVTYRYDCAVISEFVAIKSVVGGDRQ